MKFGIFSLFIFILLQFGCGKKFDPENGVLVETIQATSYQEGHRPENVFISGESWKPLPSESPMDGITFFFANEAFVESKGSIIGNSKIDEISFVCPSGAVQKYTVYVNASYSGSAKCGEKFPIGARVHSLYVQPDLFSKDPIELDELELFRQGKKVTVLFPIGLPGKVTASSVADPKEGYPAYNLFDGAKEFGWVEGKPDDGIGESVQVDLDKELTIAGLEIYNGYQRSEEHFKKNGRVEKMSVSNGTESVSVTFLDALGGQRVFLSKPLSGKQFTFKIESAWSGEKWKDTAISEMILLGKGQERYTVSDPAFLAKEKSRIEAAKSSTLGDILGKKLFEENCGPNSGAVVIFRPNGGFVYWSQSGSATGTDTVMDGNWILEKAGKSESQIYIFGRLYRVFRTRVGGDGSGPYDENAISEESKTEIFSDRIKIDKDSNPIQCESEPKVAAKFGLKGAKIYGSFY